MNRTCGLDVHKDRIFACILDEKGGKFFEQRYNPKHACPNIFLKDYEKR